MQVSSHHPIESFLSLMIPLVAMIFNYGFYRLTDIIEKGILRVVERGMEVGVLLGLNDSLFYRAYHEHKRYRKKSFHLKQLVILFGYPML